MWSINVFTEADPFQTDEDSDYVPDKNEEVEVEGHEEVDDEHENAYVHVTPAKTRQRKRRPKEWKDNTAKRLQEKSILDGKRRYGMQEN